MKLFIALLVFSNFYFGVLRAEMSVETTQLSRWMTRSPALEDRALNRIIIPGSHDSGSDEISLTSPLCPGEISSWANLAKPIVIRLAKAQQLDIYNQLKAGARYLDIRVCYYKKEFYTHHTVISAKLRKQLQMIKRFSTENPQETIIVHVQSIKGISDTAQYDSLGNLFREELSPLIADPKHLKPSSTLREFRAMQTPIVVLMRNKKKMSAALQNMFWDTKLIRNPCPQVSHEKDLLTKLEKLHSFDPKKFYVTQMVLTPDSKSILKYPLRSLRDYAALEKKLFFTNLDWFRSQKRIHNIILFDAIDQKDLVPTILQLNKSISE